MEVQKLVSLDLMIQTGKFTFIPDATDIVAVFSGTAGTVVAGTLEGNCNNATTVLRAAQQQLLLLSKLSNNRNNYNR